MNHCPRFAEDEAPAGRGPARRAGSPVAGPGHRGPPRPHGRPPSSWRCSTGRGLLPRHPHARPDGAGRGGGLAEDWPLDADSPFPLFVFVTAYDQYAVQAFERRGGGLADAQARADRPPAWPLQRLTAASPALGPSARRRQRCAGASVEPVGALLGAAPSVETNQRLRVVQVAQRQPTC